MDNQENVLLKLALSYKKLCFQSCARKKTRTQNMMSISFKVWVSELTQISFVADSSRGL